MLSDIEKFDRWYVAPLERLYADRDSGFVLLLISFPVLERYIRQKCGVSPDVSLPDSCMKLLCFIFPSLKDCRTARMFWNVYRNGLLHQVTLSLKSRRGAELPAGWLSHDGTESICVDIQGSFLLNPVLFSQQVVRTVRGDFDVFAGVSTSAPQLPVVLPYSSPLDGIGLSNVYLGTRSKPP